VGVALAIGILLGSADINAHEALLSSSQQWSAGTLTRAHVLRRDVCREMETIASPMEIQYTDQSV
jgi:hypothetical protein